MNLGDILRQYSLPQGAPPPGDAQAHFEMAAQQAPHEMVADALSESFRSERTPPFGEMVADAFRHSSPEQRSGVLNQILGSLGGAAGGGLLGGALGQILGRFGNNVPPDHAANLSPDQVKDIANEAEKHDPSVIERVSDFYARHPDLVRRLGTAALTIALAHMASRNRQH